MEDAARARGWKLLKEGDDPRRASVIWVDRSTNFWRAGLLTDLWQRVNHFPGMGHVSNKTSLARNLGKMQKTFPREYEFIPRRFVGIGRP